MGKAASPMSLLGSGTALPGCRASSLHQQIASIPFLQELPRAPRKGEKQMWGLPGPLKSLEGAPKTSTWDCHERWRGSYQRCLGARRSPLICALS